MKKGGKKQATHENIDYFPEKGKKEEFIFNEAPVEKPKGREKARIDKKRKAMEGDMAKLEEFAKSIQERETGFIRDHRTQTKEANDDDEMSDLDMIDGMMQKVSKRDGKEKTKGKISEKEETKEGLKTANKIKPLVILGTLTSRNLKEEL
jgi:hypothetical protein